VKLTITCEDLEWAGYWDTANCCSSCHASVEDGWDEMVEMYIPNKRGKPSIWECMPNPYVELEVRVCCACARALEDKLTREDWARILREKRKRR